MAEFKTVKEDLQSALVSTVKSVNKLASQDLAFQRTVNSDNDERLDANTTRLLTLATQLLKAAPRPNRLAPPKLEETDDVDMNWRRIVDIIDATFEQADLALDEYTGLVKRKEAPTTEPENVCCRHWKYAAIGFVFLVSPLMPRL